MKLLWHIMLMPRIWALTLGIPAIVMGCRWM